MDFLVTLQAYINLKAVIVAVAGTQFIKYLLPAPPKEAITWWDKFEVRSGPFLSRVVVFLPVIIAFIVTYFLERDSTYSNEDIVRGICSGAFAAYTYRTTKTMIFGEAT
jgi:hypothetical protein